jgi:multidrug efflux pump subunit AcrB
LTDIDVDELNHWAPIIEAGMKELPELQQVASDQQIAAAHLAIEIDRDAAYRLGLSADLIDQTLYDAFGQRQVATIYTATNQYKVVLEVQPQFQHDPNLLSEIYVSGPSGAQVPLSAFAHFTRKSEPLLLSPGGDAVVQFDARSVARTGGRRHPGHDRTPARTADVEFLVRGDGTGLPGLAVIDAAVVGRSDPRRLHRPWRLV